MLRYIFGILLIELIYCENNAPECVENNGNIIYSDCRCGTNICNYGNYCYDGFCLENKQVPMASASCSSDYRDSVSYACAHAIDGHKHTAWASNNQGVGTWIKITFPEKYILTNMMFHNRDLGRTRDDTEGSKKALLTFSDGTTQTVDLNYQETMIDIENSNPVLDVKIQTLEVHGGNARYVGAEDIKFFGSKTQVCTISNVVQTGKQCVCSGTICSDNQFCYDDMCNDNAKACIVSEMYETGKRCDCSGNICSRSQFCYEDECHDGGKVNWIWTRIGSDIIGQNKEERLGENIKSSKDGYTIAIGGYQGGAHTDDGIIRVYQFVNNNWVLKGNPIVGEYAEDRIFGAFDISADGNRIIYQNHDYSKIDRKDYIKILDFDGSDWVQFGEKIEFGGAKVRGWNYGLAMNAAGNMFISAQRHPRYPKIIVYEFDSVNSNWKQKGQILGTPGNNNGLQHIDMNDDGLTILISTAHYGTDWNNHNSGYGFVYRWNDNENKWKTLSGASWHGGNRRNRAVGYWAQLNGDGNIYGYFDYGQLQIFNKTYQNQMGGIIRLGHPRYFSISDSGKRVAIINHNHNNEKGENVGRAYIQHFNGNKWNILGNIIYGDEGDFLGGKCKLSGNGKRFFAAHTGYKENDISYGKVRAYTLYSQCHYFSSITGGREFTCFINQNQNIECFGNNMEITENVPYGKFKMLSAGYNFICGLSAIDHSISCFGKFNNQIGLGNTPPSGGSYLMIAAGWQHVCAITFDKTIECWGNDYEGKTIGDTPTDGPYSMISAGSDFTCAIKEDDETVHCWGCDENQKVTGAPSGKIKMVSCGMSHCCAINNDNTLNCWNSGDVQNAPKGEYKFVSSYQDYSCAICMEDNSIKCWGDNISIDYELNAPSGKFINIGTFRHHQNCVVNEFGAINCWGDDVPQVNGPNNSELRAWIPLPCRVCENSEDVPNDYKCICGDSKFTCSSSQFCYDNSCHDNAKIMPTSAPSTSEPTYLPSKNPTTTDPTNSPTSMPTSSPTKKPSLEPSTSPTSNPTSSPTYSPTSIPTLVPTYNPTTKPSFQPTKLPSDMPSISPTFIPTPSPTYPPSNLPTTSIPTSLPSSNPTTKPSFEPTNVPSNSPSISPTSMPTPSPTMMPSEKPSISPTSMPTPSPTIMPSTSPIISIPTSTPSMNPSTTKPTNIPSQEPSTSPTSMPTPCPTTSPTNQPSTSPSFMPTIIPTTVPSTMPSIIPSTPPSIIPTAVPSNIPTEMPSVFPTIVPSEIPSAFPSFIPTILPSEIPTKVPSVFPTNVPSQNPTTQIPTQFPTSTHIEYNITFRNDYERAIIYSVEKFLMDCTQAVQKLGTFDHVVCLDVYSGSVIVTLKGPQNEVEEATSFISNSGGLLLDYVFLIKPAPKIHSDIPSHNSDDEDKNVNLLEKYNFEIFAVLCLLIMGNCCYFCFSYFNTKKMKKGIELQKDTIHLEKGRGSLAPIDSKQPVISSTADGSLPVIVVKESEDDVSKRFVSKTSTTVDGTWTKVVE
jgi:hypothetical protein